MAQEFSGSHPTAVTKACPERSRRAGPESGAL